jgi:hypothetical protein
MVYNFTCSLPMLCLHRLLHVALQCDPIDIEWLLTPPFAEMYSPLLSLFLRCLLQHPLLVQMADPASGMLLKAVTMIFF